MRLSMNSDDQTWPTYKQLWEENRLLKEQLQAAQARSRELEGQLEKLLRQVEQLRREGKRQAAPFRKPDGPKPKPKPPGRKPGEAHGPHAHRAAIPPAEIDEHYDVPLPEQCPHCGHGQLHETGTAKQYQTEIPRR